MTKITLSEPYAFVDTYPEQESYFETLAHNMAIIGEREQWTRLNDDLRFSLYRLKCKKINQVADDTSLANLESAVQENEHRLARCEYRQWCLLNNLEYSAVSLFED